MPGDTILEKVPSKQHCSPRYQPKLCAGSPPEAQFAVGIVFQYQDIAPSEDIRYLGTNSFGIAQAGGVLKVGDQIGEFRALLVDSPAQGADIDAIFAERNRDNLRVIQMKCLQGGKIGWTLHQDAVTRVDHHGGEKVERLLGAVCHDDFSRIDGEP